VNLATHFLFGWAVANAVPVGKRDRLLIVAASVAPDIDGLVVVGDFIAGHAADDLVWWSRWHHVLGHNLGFALAITVLCFILARRRALTSITAFLTVHLHFLCDVVGARGPEGSQWPIPYLLPFSNSVQLTWSGQWELNAWPNFVITGALLVLTFYLAWYRGFSPVELISAKADSLVVSTLRRRFGTPGAGGHQ
jgi:inner membrane protein